MSSSSTPSARRRAAGLALAVRQRRAPSVQDGTLPGQEQWRWDMAGNPLEGVGEKNAHSRPDLLDGEGNKILNTKGLPIKTRQYEFRDSNNKPVFIQEHSLGHDKATSGHGAEPHFTVRPPTKFEYR
jgi:hypothetical protein